MKDPEIIMLKDTLQIFKQGYYYKDNKKIELKLSKEEQREVKVFLPTEVNNFANHKLQEKIHVIGRCGHSCENMDSFSLARRIDAYRNKGSKEVLVLNFANPVHPGGGVRRGALAQEEDLCRKSSLLLSLESKDASIYYKHNKRLHTNMGSKAIIITPKVEIIKDADGNLLDETAVVAVMTCAAPDINTEYGYEGMSEETYQNMFYHRILGMLRCAVVMGYKYLVLGAFGCGAFGNDAKVVSDLFYKALKEFELDGMREKDLFNRIDFAVLSRSQDQYNFNEFYRNFGGDNFFRDEIDAEIRRILEKKHEKDKYLDKIKGSLIGGAAGDALGYAVEFLQDYQIFEKYGETGITEYSLVNGTAPISDDTQMTLFTANGILVGETRLAMRGIGGNPSAYVPCSYQDWLVTQEVDYEKGKNIKRFYKGRGISWLLDVPELYARCAPGHTCLSALKMRRNGYDDDFLNSPINNSKGCGGIMRIAPLGLHYHPGTKEWLKVLQKTAAELSAITHGHSLGYMPSAVFAHIINQIIYPLENKTLKEIIVEARDTALEVFEGDQNLLVLTKIINNAIELSENNLDDLENIRSLGEGWVAEETLAIAIYCSLKYQNDFSKGIIAAVNHSGDSDSTGAVTGNILGSLLGYENIEKKWKERLELRDVILEMADDLCYGCLMSEYSSYHDKDWVRKYMDMHWKEYPNISEPQTVLDIINSSKLDEINRFLRNNGNT